MTLATTVTLPVAPRDGADGDSCCRALHTLSGGRLVAGRGPRFFGARLRGGGNPLRRALARASTKRSRRCAAMLRPGARSRRPVDRQLGLPGRAAARRPARRRLDGVGLQHDAGRFRPGLTGCLRSLPSAMATTWLYITESRRGRPHARRGPRPELDRARSTTCAPCPSARRRSAPSDSRRAGRRATGVPVARRRRIAAAPALPGVRRPAPLTLTSRIVRGATSALDSVDYSASLLYGASPCLLAGGCVSRCCAWLRLG